MRDAFFDTIDCAKWGKLPIYKQAPTYQVDPHQGAGCFGDPPGYPSYFAQHVWTKYGNSPRCGAIALLRGRVVQTAEDDWDSFKRVYTNLYKPLPIEHPRVRAWIIFNYSYFSHCYSPDGIDRNCSNTIIYPVPYYKLETYRHDERFSKEYEAKARLEVEEYNERIEAEYKALAIPEHHLAVLAIREHYPDYQPELDLIENPPKNDIGNWWERYDERPTPETCPGDQRVGIKHRTDGWCQFCGYGGQDV